MRTKTTRDWSVGLGLALAFLASLISQKVMFADGVQFFIRGLIDPVQFDVLDPRVLAIFTKNILSMLYSWAGGRQINTALLLYSVGAFLPATLGVWVMRQRMVHGEEGAALVLLALLMGVFLLINFPASELIFCHVITCLLAHGYLSGRVKAWPLMSVLAILVASLSYEISVITNAVFMAYIAIKPARRTQYRWQFLAHLLGIVLVVWVVRQRGVNGNASGLYGLMIALSLLVMGLALAGAFLLRKHWGLVLGLCATAVVLVATHLLPDLVFGVLGRVYLYLSYGGRGATAMIALATPLILWLPPLARWPWPKDWAQGLDALVVMWCAFQVVCAMAWGMYWSDFKAAVAKQPPVVTFEQCQACRDGREVYGHGVFAGWSWTWAQASAIASLQLGLDARQVVEQKVGFATVTPEEYDRIWARFARKP